MEFFNSLSKFLDYVFIQHFLTVVIVIVSALLLWALWLLYMRVRRWQVRNLKYERGFSRGGVFEGEGVVFWEQITNTTSLPLLMVDIEAYLYSELALEGYAGARADDMQYFFSRFNLAPNQTLRRSRRVTAKKRGVYSLTTVSVYVRKVPFHFNAPAKIYVYPKFKNVEEYSQPVNTLQGDVITKRRLITDPFNVSGIRDLAPGDPFNLINFKATAKTGGRVIKVNEREFCSGRVFMIFIDFTPPDDYRMTPQRYDAIMEDTLSLCASIVRRALNSGYKVGFAANCKKINGTMFTGFTPASGSGVLEEMLKEMAGMRFDCGISFTAMLADYLPRVRDSEVYVMTPAVSAEFNAYIKSYKRRNNNVLIFNIGK